MTFDALLTIALDVAFFAVLGFTLRDYLRNRERVRLVVVLVFASLAVILVASPIRAVLPALGPVLTFVSLPSLLAQPILVLWLASFVRPMHRGVLWAATAAFISLSAGLTLVVIAGGSGTSSSGGVARSPLLATIAI